jgi:ADP-ribose pyrophosphatase YjhB (NUDIX family)
MVISNILLNAMNTTEIITFGEATYEFSWIEGGLPAVEHVSQVSGYIFNGKKEMLIVKNKQWTIPGGHPEEGEEYIETLIREVREESNVEIKNIVYIGQVRVTHISNGEVTFQLRYTAEVDVINDFEQKEFEVSERLFISPAELTTYIPWANGVVFSTEVNTAVRAQGQSLSS